MGCKKQRAKNRVIIIQKEKRQPELLDLNRVKLITKRRYNNIFFMIGHIYLTMVKQRQ